MKIVTVVGARPQFVKAAVVSRLLRTDYPHVEEVLVHTGQHFDPWMSACFFEEMEIPKPAHYLGLGGLSHGAMTGRMIEALEALFSSERPDWLLVYGDTNSTLAAALAAAKMGIGVAHVEAGLRSFNRTMPEEINRIVCDQIADLLFAPTERAVANLEREGIALEKVVRTGDVMLDAALFYRELAEKREPLSRGDYLLATLHRQENVDDPERLGSILEGLCRLAEEVEVILPLHPRTRARIEKGGFSIGAVRAIDPVGYLDMVRLESGALAIVTDSGGVQREAFFFGVPSLVLRDETEWVELVESGFARLVGACPERLLKGVQSVTRADLDWDRPLYGDGSAGREVLERLIQ